LNISRPRGHAESYGTSGASASICRTASEALSGLSLTRWRRRILSTNDFCKVKVSACESRETRGRPRPRRGFAVSATMVGSLSGIFLLCNYFSIILIEISKVAR
jgi:hypothetical protein